MFKKKFNGFKKCGYTIVVRTTQEGEDWGVNEDRNKMLVHYNNGRVVNVETYNVVKAESYKKQGISVVDISNKKPFNLGTEEIRGVFQSPVKL